MNNLSRLYLLSFVLRRYGSTGVDVSGGQKPLLLVNLVIVKVSRLQAMFTPLVLTTLELHLVVICATHEVFSIARRLLFHRVEFFRCAEIARLVLFVLILFWTAPL